MKGPMNHLVASLHRMQTQTADAPRRTTHGSCAWTLPFSNTALRQPQDGASRDTALTNSTAPVTSTRLKKLRSLAAPDTDDDRLSGATRSLSNRILGLNGFTLRRMLPEVEPERYFAEPLRMPDLKPLRKTPKVLGLPARANVA